MKHAGSQRLERTVNHRGPRLAAARSSPPPLNPAVSHMKLIPAILGAFALLLLAACREEMSPVVTGSVSYMTGDKTWVEKPLTQQQLQSLSTWLARSSSNWRRCLITPPGSTLNIYLKHADGTTSSLALLHFENSQTTLRTQHLSGSNLSDQPCALQSFSQEDIGTLRALVDVPK